MRNRWSWLAAAGCVVVAASYPAVEIRARAAGAVPSAVQPVAQAAPVQPAAAKSVPSKADPAAPLTAAGNAAATAARSDAVYESAVKPLLQQNCVGCHNPTKMKGDVDLQQYLTKSSTDALKNREALELVVAKLKAGEMPPPGKPRPPMEQVEAATNWIAQQYALADSKLPLNPGRVTAHRLNRYEYNNTVRDLLALNLHFADDFPPDPYGYGFDNIGDVLSLSPSLTEKYMKAAEQVANAAIPLGAPPQSVQTRYEPQRMGQRNRTRVRVMHDFPVDAVYTFRFGWEETVTKGTLGTAHFYIDGKEVSRQPMVINRVQEEAMYARDIPVSQGPHLFEAWSEVSADSPVPPGKKAHVPDITEIEVIGPKNPVPRQQTVSYQRIFFKGPPVKAGQDAYNREILERLAHRAYRAPVTKPEMDRLLKLTKLVRSHGGSFEEGVQVALEAVLMSPEFLFRIEQDPPAQTAHRVSDVELASRLSYFLWSSMPDDELLATAEAGKLSTPAVLHAEVRRMLADPKAHSLAENFAGQWLETRNLQFQKPDHKTFPQYDAELEDAMRTETEMFFQSIITEDRSVLDFIDGKYTFLNERLAQLYGINGVSGPEFRRVSLDGTERSGVITQASVLRASSYPTRTSPVIRGKWVLENILNAPPPAPPANVPALDDKGTGTAASVRQRLEEHRANPVCAGCHSRMDPLGFALENYDSIGRWRTTEGTLPIDAKGELPDGRTFTGAEELKKLLRADSPRFVRGLTEKMLTYAMGRGVESYDKPAVETIARRVEANGDHFSQIIDGIVESAPFQMREREKPLPTAPNQKALTASVSRFIHPQTVAEIRTAKTE
jgi:mono/diheme cytochrome c family protein